MQQGLLEAVRDTFRTPVKQLGQKHWMPAPQLDTALDDNDIAADASQPYTVHLYSPQSSNPRLVNVNPMKRGALQQNRFDSIPQQPHQQQNCHSAGGHLQSRQLGSGLGHKGRLASSQLQLRTPARPNSAGSALRGFVPPDHRYVPGDKIFHIVWSVT